MSKTPVYTKADNSKNFSVFRLCGIREKRRKERSDHCQVQTKYLLRRNLFKYKTDLTVWCRNRQERWVLKYTY